MSTRARRSAIDRCLKRDYGIRKYRIVRWGPHPKLILQDEGVEKVIPLHNLSPYESGGTRVENLDLQNIRARLGPKRIQQSPPKPKRGLDQMTQETVRFAKEHGLLKELPPASLKETFLGKVSLTPTKDRGPILTFVFPESIRSQIGARAMIAAKDGPSSWIFRTASEGKRHLGKYGVLLYVNPGPLLPDDQSLFGRSPIEMIMVGDEILAHLNPGDRRPIHTKFRTKRNKDLTEPPKIMETYPMQIARNPLIEVPDLGIPQPEKVEKPLTRDEMVQLAERTLQAVKDLERLTLYRLARVTLPDGTKVWRAVVDPVE